MSAVRTKIPSRSPGLVGLRFGKLRVVSEEISRDRNGKARLLTECVSYNRQSLRDYSSVLASKAGCRKCGNPIRVPMWLYKRAQAAQARCSNPQCVAYAHYGARGIQFLFTGPLEMALWVQEHLGLHRALEIDRIDNDGNYEPGNLRYLTRRQQMSNTRTRRNTAKMHGFRQRHPEIRYADCTLAHMLGAEMTDTEIVERFHRYSCKPKGVYGTFSTPDPVIASLSKDC